MTSKPTEFTAIVSLGVGRRPMWMPGRLLLREVDAHRNVRCSDYDRCLDAVLAAKWAGWSCAVCPKSGLTAAPITAREALDDAEFEALQEQDVVTVEAVLRDHLDHLSAAG